MPNFKRTKLACYTAYFTMSSIFSLPPILFVTLRETYGISYTLLGTLVLTNFCTQMLIDLAFTLFSKHFNIKQIVRVMPLITSLGLFLYALSPILFPNHVYAGLWLSTVIFSISAGLSEVLLSPVIAAIPSDNPQRDMSALHSLYAFGVFTVVVVSTLFLKVFGSEHWQILTAMWALLPVLSAVMFMTSPMPDMTPAASTGGNVRTRFKVIGLTLCTFCIFLGSCAENTMSNWISGFMENALHIDKALGDILGMALFAILLGIARISYARYGKRIMPVLIVGMIGSAICYLVIGLSSGTMLAFLGCILTGLFSSMLWPGTLILMEEKIPGVGVAAYALMASGGDLGASVAPQLMGIVIDRVTVSEYAARRALETGLTPEQIGMKTGMLVTSLFPIAGIFLLLIIIRYFKKNASETQAVPTKAS